MEPVSDENLARGVHNSASDGKELAAIDAHRQRGLTIAQAIQAVMNDEESHGAKTSKKEEEQVSVEDLEEILRA